jgi:Protein of unknown function (DUF559)
VGAGLPPPVQQMPVPGHRPSHGLVDAAYPHARLILEADGRRWHTRVQDLRRDHERDSQAARAGWQTLRFVYEQIVHAPDEVAAVVADVIAVRSPEGREDPRQWGSSRRSRGNGVRPPTAMASGAGQRPLMPRVPVRAEH